MKRIFIILAAFTLSLATQAQTKDKYEGLKKISPDRSKGSTTIIHIPDEDITINLRDLNIGDMEIDLSSLESLNELSALSALGELESLEELEVLSDLEALEVLVDGEFLEDIIEISIDASLMSLDILRDLEVKPRKAEQ